MVGSKESCAQPEVTIIYLGGALSSCRNRKILLCIFLKEESESRPNIALYFLDSYSFFSASPSFLDELLFESAF